MSVYLYRWCPESANRHRLLETPCVVRTAREDASWVEEDSTVYLITI
jgi:hypothetical protein